MYSPLPSSRGAANEKNASGHYFFNFFSKSFFFIIFFYFFIFLRIRKVSTPPILCHFGGPIIYLLVIGINNLRDTPFQDEIFKHDYKLISWKIVLLRSLLNSANGILTQSRDDGSLCSDHIRDSINLFYKKFITRRQTK